MAAPANLQSRPMIEKNNVSSLLQHIFRSILRPGLSRRARSLLLPCLLSFAACQGIVLSCTEAVFALQPEEIAVVANKNVRQGVELARYYMAQRHIPEENLLLLELPEAESCGRDDYLKKIDLPLRDFLLKKSEANRKMRCLTLMYGLPLRVVSPPLLPADKANIERLRKEEKKRAADLSKLPENSAEKRALQQEVQKIRAELSQVERKDQEAAVDSEIALVLVPEHPLSGWIDNPLFVMNKGRRLMVPAEEVLLVSRLDGPDPETVKRVIDQSLAAEKNGLSGKVCLDARWQKKSKPGVLNGYALYDQAIHRTAAIMEERKLPVLLDAGEELFPAGSNIETALYCGWYSLAKYVDAFSWQPGSVGYHIASSECSTLKKKNSRVWCKMMLEKGIAATIGPVSEPYVQAFPLPDIFFDLLTRGEKTLVECYLLSLPYLSWKMVLIGDPLYTPFGRHAGQ